MTNRKSLGVTFVGLEESSPPSKDAKSGRSRSLSAQRLAAQLLDEDDQGFIDALREAGVLVELEAEELLRVASEVSETDAERRHVDLLEIYYAAGGDEEASRRRRLTDRFFLQRADTPTTAAGLVARLAELTPELPGLCLERIGGGDGPLVLRSGENMSAVLDDYEEDTDSDQIDIEAAEARKRGVAMVTLRGLVHALNVLLAREEVHDRLIALCGDDDREVYVSLGKMSAIDLARAGYLGDEDNEAVVDLGSW